MLFDEGTHLVMVGDSVTEHSYSLAAGEGEDYEIGKGYPSIVKSMLMCRYPDLNIRVSNMGLSCSSTLDLKERWQKDVINLKPDYISICIGINDVLNFFIRPRVSEQIVNIDLYIQILEELVVSTMPLVKNIIMITPYYLSTNRQDAMRKRMDKYSDACRNIAAKYELILFDLQAAYDRLLTHLNYKVISQDKIHPNDIGTMFMAIEFLKKIDFDFTNL